MARKITSRAQQGYVFGVLGGPPWAHTMAHRAGMTGGKKGKHAYAALPRRVRTGGKRRR